MGSAHQQLRARWACPVVIAQKRGSDRGLIRFITAKCWSKRSVCPQGNELPAQVDPEVHAVARQITISIESSLNVPLATLQFREALLAGSNELCDRLVRQAYWRSASAVLLP